jgi:hypothetical protein
LQNNPTQIIIRSLDLGRCSIFQEYGGLGDEEGLWYYCLCREEKIADKMRLRNMYEYISEMLFKIDRTLQIEQWNERLRSAKKIKNKG